MAASAPWERPSTWNVTNEEIKDALYAETPVEYHGIKYRCISAIIYRKGQDTKTDITVELLDKCGHSVTIAPAKDVNSV